MDPSTAQVSSTGNDLVAKTKTYLEARDLISKDQTAPTSTAANASRTPTSNISVRGITNIVDALFTKGIINETVAKSVKLESLTRNQTVEQVLQLSAGVSDIQIQQIKAEIYGMGYIDLSAITIDIKTLNRIPKDVGARNMAIAFEENADRLKVGMVDPLDLQKVKFLESLVGKRVDGYFAAQSVIQKIVDTKYGAQITNDVNKALEDVGVVDITQSLKVEDLNSSDLGGAPVSKIVNMILDYAIKHQASDIHIEPRENKIAVRYRVHGLLEEKLSLPPTLASNVIARIKILANMKIDEHRIPQDNRFQVKTGNDAADIRVSVLPTIYGEKVVMRLLEKDQGGLKLEDTGLRGPAYKLFKEALGRTQGIILITGPTGSGKTLTLASSLAILNRESVNIMTIEDPVEIRLDGITQVQVNAEIGLTFASGLRSFLRQDPDIIMIGEIRDSETAELAVQASLVGRLVLATLHTNSAAGALPRLLDMGVEPFLLSSTINVIVAQRLVRKLCDNCKQQYEATSEMISMFHRTLDGLKGFDITPAGNGNRIHFDTVTQKVNLFKAVGCPKCGDTGYTGRIGIFEVMRVSDKIGKMIMQQSSAGEIGNQAISEGMITMVQDGFMKALEGVTTMEEVIRVQNT